MSAAPSSSMAPSSVPTPSYEYEMIRLLSRNVKIVAFLGSRRLQDSESQSCDEQWQGYVEERIKEEVAQVVPRFEMLEVNLFNATRNIDTQAATLVLSFDVAIEIRSALTESQHNVRRYIRAPFDSQEEQDDFITFLRSTSCPGFSQVNAVGLELPSESSRSGGGSSISTGLVAGLATGLAALFLLGAIFIFARNRNRRRLALALQEPDDRPLPFADSEDNEYVSGIEVRTTGGISSLGDPLPMDMAGIGGMDGATQESISIDYDYQKAYADPPSVSEPSTTGDTTGSIAKNLLLSPDGKSLQTDDKTLKVMYMSGEQFEVTIPPGPLGIILESNDEGVPTVMMIKEQSVLVDEVRAGDRLISVDETDVSVMLASEVAKLIQSKKGEERKLVFVRGS